MKILVGHTGYGCETGCCGHTVVMADDSHTFEDVEYNADSMRNFVFDHPDEDKLEWAKELVRKVYGEEHVADLDWANCKVLDDDDPSWNH